MAAGTSRVDRWPPRSVEGRSTPRRHVGTCRDVVAWRVPYPGRVTVFRSPSVFDEEFWQPHPYFGWEEVALGGVEVVDISVRREDILHLGHVGPVAQKLRQALATAMRPQRSQEVPEARRPVHTADDGGSDTDAERARPG